MRLHSRLCSMAVACGRGRERSQVHLDGMRWPAARMRDIRCSQLPGHKSLTMSSTVASAVAIEAKLRAARNAPMRLAAPNGILRAPQPCDASA